MKLTGKAKEEFEMWFIIKGMYWSVPCSCSGIKPDPTAEDFYDLPKSMQWGVYQDWADSLGYDVFVESSIEQDRYWFTVWSQDEKYEHLRDSYYATREEARNAAVDKLDELINGEYI